MVVPGMRLAQRYEILEKIGSGGMSDVYKAKDHKLNRLVAVKVLKQEFSVDETFVKKFRVEAQAAAGLTHPNIVNVYDVGEEHAIHYIIMELVQGITLKKYIEMKGKLDIKEALNISVQIASGLQAAHDNRIIHRDIKPQNIIMSRDGKVKVTDFGIAKMADSTTVTTNAAGSVHYISPEQARGGYSDAKSDIYSLGITMYEMLTGKVPFEGETNVAVALLHIQAEMVPPRRLEPSIPRSFEKIILKCTQKKPDRRYSSARELIADLRKVLTHPDGDYVVLSGMSAAVSSAASQQTMVLDSVHVGGQSSSRAGAAAGTGGSGRSSAGSGYRTGGSTGRSQGDGSRTGSANGRSGGDYSGDRSGSYNNRRKGPDYDVEDEDGDSVNPALEKLMMVLGIVGAVILVVVIFFIIGRAAGLFSGGAKDTKESQTIETVETQMLETKETETLETEETQEDQVDVPDLSRMTQEEAQAKLKDYGLYLSVKFGESDQVQEGQIYDQSPKAGERVAKRETITVYINRKDKVIIDAVEGYSYDQIKQMMDVKGIVIGDIQYEFSDTIAKDIGIRTEPAAGSSINKGESVILYMSKGPQEQKVSMPQVVGLSLDEAKNTLAANNLTVGAVTEANHGTVPVGCVISASVSTGADVTAGTAIDLVISKGPEQAESEEPQIYTGLVQVLEDPLGGMEEGTTSTMIVTVYKPDGTTEAIFNGPIVVGQWAPLEQTVTSTKKGQGHFEIVVGSTSIGTGVVVFD